MLNSYRSLCQSMAIQWIKQWKRFIILKPLPGCKMQIPGCIIKARDMFIRFWIANSVCVTIGNRTFVFFIYCAFIFCFLCCKELIDTLLTKEQFFKIWIFHLFVILNHTPSFRQSEATRNLPTQRTDDF